MGRIFAKAVTNRHSKILAKTLIPVAIFSNLYKDLDICLLGNELPSITVNSEITAKSKIPVAIFSELYPRT